METVELAELIKGRRSIRVWQEKPVLEELLVQAIELATWAPNGANRQNWYFYIILNKDTIAAIADASQAGRSYMASWPEMAQGGLAPSSSTSPVSSPPPARRPGALGSAPALIAVGTSQIENPMDKVYLAREKVDERAGQMLRWSNTVNPRIQSVAAAISYLLLVLHQMGLGAVWMTGPLPQAKGDIEKILGTPPEMDIIALIPVGYPAESPTRERRPVSEVCEVVK
ncbi:MAG: nitroreductase family protein [Dehalococcoidales bacterium]|nr:MAG: nitroreductase family protein [Dehalococcoidales bacterium]